MPNNDDWIAALTLAELAGGVLRLGWAKALATINDDPNVARRHEREWDYWLLAAEAAIGILNM
ncbi:hypothetical protein D3C83_176960 [compost metagenome]